MTNAHVRARHDLEWEDREDNSHGVLEHLILECAGCETVYFQVDASDSSHMIRGEWLDELKDYEWSEEHRLIHYPAEFRRQKPSFMSKVEIQDSVLERLIRELYAALNADLRVLAAIGMRTIFDRTSELLKVDPSLTFERKLTELFDGGKIGSDEKDILNALVDAGNAAAHRGWAPTTDEIYTMMDVVEAFLKRTFVLDQSMKKIKARVPPKPTTRPKANKP
jgi:hypothetical protein